MSDARRIAKNILALTTGQLIWAVLSIIFVAVVARLLGPEDFGIYSFARSFVVLVTIFMFPGFMSVAVRNVAKDRVKAAKYFSNMISLKLVFGVLPC